MAELTEAEREAIPPGEFAMPEKAPGPGSYPIEDEAHARNALSRVAEHGTIEEKRQVRAAVRRRYPGIEQETQHNSPSEPGTVFKVTTPHGPWYTSDPAEAVSWAQAYERQGARIWRRQPSNWHVWESLGHPRLGTHAARG